MKTKQGYKVKSGFKLKEESKIKSPRIGYPKYAKK
jgi:hypothetical protein